MDLLRHSKELQFRTCKSTEKIGKSKNRRRGGLFYRGEGIGWGYINKESIGGNWEFEVWWLFKIFIFN